MNEPDFIIRWGCAECEHSTDAFVNFYDETMYLCRLDPPCVGCKNGTLIKGQIYDCEYFRLPESAFKCWECEGYEEGRRAC